MINGNLPKTNLLIAPNIVGELGSTQTKRYIIAPKSKNESVIITKNSIINYILLEYIVFNYFIIFISILSTLI